MKFRSSIRMRAVPALLLLCCFALPAHGDAGRVRLRMDANWRFHLGDVAKVDPIGIPVSEWRWKPDDAGPGDAAAMTAPNLNTAGGDWKDAHTGDDVFHGRLGSAWFRTTLDGGLVKPKAGGLQIHFEGVDDNATVYLNGRELLRHEGYSDPFDVSAGSAWHAKGSNVLAVLVENTAGMGGIIGPVTIRTDTTVASGPAAPGYGDSDWQRVDLPHDWVVAQPFDKNTDGSHGFHPRDTGWYRKTFALPAGDRGKRLTLEFDGIYRNSRIWLNGHFLGSHPSGYTSFAYDITSVARLGHANVLAVRADCLQNEGWWYEGGGIYRHVWLVKTAPVHVAHWGTYITTKVQTPATAPTVNANIGIETKVDNESSQPAAYRLISRIVDAGGKTVGTSQSTETAAPRQSRVSTHRVSLAGARLWSLETPHLYRVLTTVQQNGKTVDTYTTTFGVRTIRFDPDKGFFLNDKPVKIQGTCNHQDFAGIGVALPDRVHAFKIEKLKAMGSNAYRCSHHPYASELLDQCDQQGMLVMDENRKLGNSPEILGQVESMVCRDRNHPSIIMWSMCNEEGLQGTESGAKMFRAMKDTVLKFDKTRPVTSAMNGGWGHGDSLVEDLQGCNYNPGGYDSFHRAFPKQPIFGSETASAVSTRGIYANDPERGYVSAYDLNAPPWAQTTEVAWKSLAERDFMAGGFIWTGFDYRGEPTPYQWPCVNSHFGVMDTCGFPKDNYFYYLAWWGGKPMAHILPHWNWPGKEGQEIPVWVYSNCERVELFLNGKSLGVKETPRYSHSEWKVTYYPGKLEARGYNGGKHAATDVVETTGEPAAIRLKPDRSVISADNEDVSIIEVDVVDSAGRIVPTANRDYNFKPGTVTVANDQTPNNEVSFTVVGEGRVVGVGNGDPSSHEPDKMAKRSAFNGRCLVIVQATHKTGPIVLRATARNLKPASVTMLAAPTKTKDME